MLALALAGLAINLWLLSRHFSGGAAGIAGCGGGDCGEVLASRWAYVFRLPVTLFGAIAYIVLLASLHRRFEGCHLPAIGVIGGAACWFLFVQFFLLERYCPWCLASHGIALSLCILAIIRMRRGGAPRSSFLMAGGWLLASVLLIGLAQACGPEPVTHRIDDGQPGASAKMPAGNDRPATRDPARIPLLGSASATHVMVEYFDYQCPACRVMAGHLSALMARHPDEIAVRLAPVPMDRDCNSHVPDGSERPGSCEIAKIALAVWNHAPARFADFHREVLATPSPDRARHAAGAILGGDELDGFLAESRVMDVLRINIADWRNLSRHNSKLPKLLVRPGRMLHGLPSSEESFIQVMEQELGLK